MDNCQVASVQVHKWRINLRLMSSFLTPLPSLFFFQGPRQCGAVSAGHRRRGGRGPTDSFHLNPGVLLRERHQHPAGEQHEASGRNPRRGETWRGAHGPALCSSYCKCHYSCLLTIALLCIAHFPPDCDAGCCCPKWASVTFSAKVIVSTCMELLCNLNNL